jgi:redox-sensing transcriptional repressor
MSGGRLPPSTVARLPRYLRFLEGLPGNTGVVSSDEIAEGSGVTAVQVRKDLSFLGTIGTRGVGYEVGALRGVIIRALGLEGPLQVVIVGSGNLGSALANYRGFEARGFMVHGLYDADPERIGTEINGTVVRHVDGMVDDLAERTIDIGIVATPREAAQSVADLLVRAGVRSILNFAPVVISAPAEMTVRQVDLATELQILSYHLARTR